ncbi:MAG: hypothetical protein WC551_12960 [Patescibacteria group bacterium]
MLGIVAALLAVGSMLLFADEVAKISDDVIRDLLRRGEVCRVIGGHVWDNVPHVTLEYRPDGDYPEHRKCRLCGKVETKEPRTWK